MGPISHRDFVKLARSWDCSLVKTTKEWEVQDNKDGTRICGVASHGVNSQIKPPYIKRFLKLIKEKRTANTEDAQGKEDKEQPS